MISDVGFVLLAVWNQMTCDKLMLVRGAKSDLLLASTAAEMMERKPGVAVRCMRSLTTFAWVFGFPRQMCCCFFFPPDQVRGGGGCGPHAHVV
jgi:hypothetical protein